MLESEWNFEPSHRHATPTTWTATMALAVESISHPRALVIQLSRDSISSIRLLLAGSLALQFSSFVALSRPRHARIADSPFCVSCTRFITYLLPWWRRARSLLMWRSLALLPWRSTRTGTPSARLSLTWACTWLLRLGSLVPAPVCCSGSPWLLLCTLLVFTLLLQFSLPAFLHMMFVFFVASSLSGICRCELWLLEFRMAATP